MALAFNAPDKIAEEFKDPETVQAPDVSESNPLGLDPEKWW